MREVLNRAIEKWGVNTNLWVFVEETCELVKEISKAVRHKPDCNRIAEELADVEIAIELIKIIFEIEQEQIDKIKRNKVERLAKRLGDQNSKF